MAELTNRDELTGLYNRRYFMEALAREVSRAERYETDLVLCLMDLDHFKRINDDHGQQAGDLVLFEISKMLRKSLRQSDLLCRYGYEEFAAILPNTDLARARIVCERFRKMMSERHFRFDSSKVRLTVSMGLASCKDNGVQSPGRLIQMSGGDRQGDHPPDWHPIVAQDRNVARRHPSNKVTPSTCGRIWVANS